MIKLRDTFLPRPLSLIDRGCAAYRNARAGCNTRVDTYLTTSNDVNLMTQYTQYLERCAIFHPPPFPEPLFVHSRHCWLENVFLLSPPRRVRCSVALDISSTGLRVFPRNTFDNDVSSLPERLHEMQFNKRARLCPLQRETRSN